MRSFISSPPSFSLGTSKIKDVTHYNNNINSDSYKNICGNCKISDFNRSFHCHLPDISTKVSEDIDVLLITESWDDNPNAFTGKASEEKERGVIDPVYLGRMTQTLSFGMDRLHDRFSLEEWKEPKPTINMCFNVAVKCPAVRALQDIGVKSLNLCSTYITEEIKTLGPKNILLFGPLAIKAVLKKGRAQFLYGKVVHTEIDGHECKVGCLPSVENLRISNTEIQTHIFSILTDFFIKEKDYDTILEHEFGATVITGLTEKDIQKAVEYLSNIDCNKVAIDIETTGLNFLEEKITSISLAFKSGEERVVVALDAETLFREDIMPIIKKILADPFLVKIFHNAQFDTKFLYRDGLEVVPPIADTKIFAHLSNENEPKSLSFLTKKFFPGLV